MKEIRSYFDYVMKHFLILILLCTATNVTFSQTSLICNDLIVATLDESCSLTITPDMILEGGPYPNIGTFIVELDKTAPFGNGPWVPAVVNALDAGNTYQVRITDPSTQNKCWGNIKFKSYIQCNSLTTIALDVNGIANLAIAEVDPSDINDCSMSNSFTVAGINGLDSIDLACFHVGFSSVVLTVTDQTGNSSVCLAPLLVTDPFQVCDTCVVCPPPVYITGLEAINVLIPAFNAGNLAPFDAYGYPEFSSTCTPSDTTYEVTYYPHLSNESWFIRHWTGAGASSCEQPIIFTFEQSVTVSGTVFLDAIENCLKDPSETGFSLLKVVATLLPSNLKIVATPAANGAYSLDVNFNVLDSVAVVSLELINGVTTPCPNTLVIPVNTNIQQYNMDYSIQASTICPKMEVSIETNLMRRCVENTYFVNYCNNGLVTAENAFVTVTLDNNLAITTSSIPWTTVTGNTYTFPIGDVLPLHCATFSVKAILNCNTTIGQTICTEATVYPNTPCPSQQWNGPNIETVAYCEGDSIKLAIWNTGNQDMTEALNFIVIEDILMYRNGTFQLDSGDSMTIAMEANGATWRIEADQALGNPAADAPSSSIEACGGLNNTGLITAFPQNDDPAYVDISCAITLAAYDPNDKSATPTGYGVANTIKANTDLEYKIRFQNTGNDTAFRVVVIDTLSQHLDWASLEAGASSHSYKLSVFQGGILHFIFDPIMLPDSNINEPGSHGFASFRIAQKQDLPIGTEIKNEVSIYFDFNDAIVTNTVLHTIGAPFVSVSSQQSYLPEIKMDIQPNPFSDWSVVSLNGHVLKNGLLTLYDGLGKRVQDQIFDGNTAKIERKNLGSGLYFLQITDEGHLISTAKVMVH